MGKRGILVLVAGMVLFFSCFALAEEAYKYVGVEKCKLCHQSESKGNQYGSWKKSKHSTAYATLATDKAKELGAKQGIAKPQESEKCLKCHATASVAYAANLVAEGSKLKLEDSVQCESCHGPGEKYWNMTIMKDKEKAVANGLVVPNEAACVKCHNEESPVWEGFDFNEKVKIIAHPMPK